MPVGVRQLCAIIPPHAELLHFIFPSTQEKLISRQKTEQVASIKSLKVMRTLQYSEVIARTLFICVSLAVEVSQQ